MKDCRILNVVLGDGEVVDFLGGFISGLIGKFIVDGFSWLN